MKSNYKRLGNYIRQVDVRNRDLAVNKLVGLTINKTFIPSVANTIGTDLSNYKVISKNQFACSLMQVSRDGKMPVAIFKEDKAIMSPAYPMFEVSRPDKLLPDFLMMWFSRSEFDRQAAFYAVGGVRGSLTWDDFCDLTLPVPDDIEVQRKIVVEYQAIEQRIENNRRLIATLEATAQTIYRKMFVDDIDTENLPEGWRMGKLGEIATFKNGKVIQPIGGNFPVYGGNGVVGFHNSHNAANVIVIGRVGANCGNIQIEQGKCWINDNAMMAASNDSTLYYLYWLLNTLSLNSKSEGSSQPLLTQTILTQIDCVIPDSNTIIRFDKIAKTNENEIIQKRRENQILIQLQSLLLSQLSNL